MASSQLTIVLVVASVAAVLCAGYADDVKTGPLYHDRPYDKPVHHCPDCTCNFPTIPPFTCTCETQTCKCDNSCGDANIECNCQCPACGEVCSCALKLPTDKQYLENNCAALVNTKCEGNKDKCDACGKQPPNYAFCAGTPRLCYTAQCPRVGGLHIKATALTCCDGANNINALGVFRGVPTSNNNNPVAQGKSIDQVFNCDDGETFYVCEQVSVINTDSLSFEFITAYPEGCPNNDYQQITCTSAPSQCVSGDFSGGRITNGTQAVKPVKAAKSGKPVKAAKPVGAAEVTEP